jgi:glycerol-3-phosphate dehydrogenase subunit B
MTSGGSGADRAATHVLVVGAGVAGTAAAITAAKAGVPVVVLDGGSGASTLATGPIDWAFWQERSAPPAPQLSDAANAVLASLETHTVGEDGSVLVTLAGVVRPACGHDAGLLDVGRLGGGRVAVVDCRRPGWNAQDLVRAWGSDYAVLEATVLRDVGEAIIPDVDLAALHDDVDRLGWLSDRLREALAAAPEPWAAVVLPAMLGVDRARAEALSRSVGLPCGEAVATPGGPAGIRFERARDRALAAAGAVKLMARALAVEPASESWRVTTNEGHVIEAHAVVVATGGLIGGGLEYAPSDAALATALPALARPPLRLTLGAPLALGAHGRPLDTPGSLFGFAPESLAGPFARDAVIERAGVLARAAPEGLFAAGDVVADVPRTWLGALSEGASAGSLAARHAQAKARSIASKSSAGAPAIRL